MKSVPLDKPEAIWWKISFSCEQPEEKSYLVFERGAQGAEIEDPTTLHCFKQATKSELMQFVDELHNFGLQLISINEVVIENWVQRCQDIWPPIAVDDLTIVPCMEIESRNSHTAKDNNIYVIPGEGFGTGHHPSTRLAMKLLQRLKKQNFTTNSMFDLGTGNAILAITAYKLFNCAALAVDNDPSALDNARENIILNEASDKIKIVCGSIELAEQKFNLITANIYAEVLCRLENDFQKSIQPGGYLIMAGIMQNLAVDVATAFSPEFWKQIKLIEEDGWSAFLLQAAQ